MYQLFMNYKCVPLSTYSGFTLSYCDSSRLVSQSLFAPLSPFQVHHEVPSVSFPTLVCNVEAKYKVITDSTIKRLSHTVLYVPFRNSLSNPR